MLTIRPARQADADSIWQIFHAVVAVGETYAYDPDMPREEALARWMAPGVDVYVAEDDAGTVGTYVLKANQPGLGAHVANAAFMVDPESQMRGVGRAMGEHCLEQARRRGFRAMQFNLIVSTNDRAVALWRNLGFAIVGRLPGAFNHRRLGYVDAYVMFRSLISEADQSGNGEGAMNQRELLAVVEDTWRRLDEATDGLDDAAMTEPGVVEQWSVKDLLGHVTAWEQMALLHVEQARRGETPTGLGETTLDQYNAREAAKRRDWSLQQVRQESAETRRQLRAMLESMTDEEWTTVHGEGERAAPLSTWVGRALAGDELGTHAAEHAQQIRAWRDQRGP
jgi:L-amino acid N-acyltransferase YncA